MEYFIEPQEKATGVWTYKVVGGKHILTDGTLEVDGKSIDELNRRARGLVNHLNSLRVEYGLKGQMRHVCVQDNPLTKPLPYWCIYHDENSANPLAMAEAGRNEERVEQLEQMLRVARETIGLVGDGKGKTTIKQINELLGES